MQRRIAKVTAAALLIASSDLAAQTTAFQYKGTAVLGGNPVAVVSADFNQDGKKDLAFALLGSDAVSVLTGSGDGSFQPHGRYSIGKNPGSIVTGDWNGDGKTDLAVICQGLESAAAPGITILFGTGDGSFLPGPSVSVNGGPTAIATADFNRDGRADLVVSYGSQADPPFTIFLGGRDGSFDAVVPITGGRTRKPASQLQSIAVGDLNGDGRLDVVLSPRLESPDIGNFHPAGTADSIAVALGNGDGSFLPVQRLAIGDNLTGMVSGDFDGDGALDLAVIDDHETAFLDGTLLLLRGDGVGGFSPPTGRQLGFGLPATIAACDINGDNLPDLVAPQFTLIFGGWFFYIPPQEAALWIFEGRGDGSFRSEKYSRFNAYYDESGKLLHCADLNNDGKVDLVFLNADSASVWLNESSRGVSNGSTLP